MQSIRHWALTLCVCCVLCAALQLLLPEKGASKVIKTVLALYILLSAVSPVPKADWSDFWQQLNQAPQVEPLVLEEVDDMAQKQFEQNLCHKLQTMLWQNGIAASVQVSAKLEFQTGNAQVAAVTILLEHPNQTQTAQNLVREFLGTTTEIECITKDEEP